MIRGWHSELCGPQGQEASGGTSWAGPCMCFTLWDSVWEKGFLHLIYAGNNRSDPTNHRDIAEEEEEEGEEEGWWHLFQMTCISL